MILDDAAWYYKLYVMVYNMEKVIRDDYVFEIDIEKTEALYSHLPRISASLSGYLPELTQFFGSLGIDIEKPIKYKPGDTSDLLYRTYGTYTCGQGYEMDFYGKDKFVSVVVHARQRYVDVEVFGVLHKPLPLPFGKLNGY